MPTLKRLILLLLIMVSLRTFFLFLVSFSTVTLFLSPLSYPPYSHWSLSQTLSLFLSLFPLCSSQSTSPANSFSVSRPWSLNSRYVQCKMYSKCTFPWSGTNVKTKETSLRNSSNVQRNALVCIRFLVQRWMRSMFSLM